MSNAEHIERAKAILGRITPTRPVWIRCDGRFQIGHSGDMTQMLDDMGIPVTA